MFFYAVAIVITLLPDAPNGEEAYGIEKCISSVFNIKITVVSACFCFGTLSSVKS
jgi:hypothetical protein